MKLTQRLQGASHGSSYHYGLKRVNTNVSGRINGYHHFTINARPNTGNLRFNLKAGLKWAPVGILGVYWVLPHFTFFVSNAWKALRGVDIKGFPENKDTYTFTDASDM